MTQHLHTVADGTPNAVVARAPQNDAVEAKECGEVGDAGVVTDKNAAVLESIGEFNQRKFQGNVAAAQRDEFGQLRETITFGFAADEQDVVVAGRDEMLEERAPVLFGPVFLGAAAAGVDGDFV